MEVIDENSSCICITNVYTSRFREPYGIYDNRWAIINRVKAQSWYGDHIKGVCLKEWQFSCWNDNDPNKEKILALDWSDTAFCKAVTLSYYFTKNKIDDNTNGATHYHTKTISPNWAEGKTPCAEIGDHLFYNDIE